MKMRVCVLLFIVVLTRAAGAASPRCDFPQRKTTVDGDLRERDAIAPKIVRGWEHLWFGQGMGMGFRVPGVALQAGETIGVAIDVCDDDVCDDDVCDDDVCDDDVCDDDGRGRESIMMWTGTKRAFWNTMDDYGTATLTEPPKLQSRRNEDGTWGILVTGAGLASPEQPRPLQVEIWNESKGYARSLSGGYASLAAAGKYGLRGEGRLELEGGAWFEFKDRWVLDGGVLHLSRKVMVHGNASGGFLSAATIRVTEPQSWPDVQWFAPGMIYGGFDNLTVHAIGGRAYYQPGSYTVRIREDRLPAPLLAAHFGDGSTLAVLDARPDGRTTNEDGMSIAPGVLVDERFRFGAIGGEERDTGLSLGYWFPGTEGEETYLGNTYPGGQLHQWRRRYHPIRDGHEQSYDVAFRIARDGSFPACMAATWRWAWKTLDPQVNPHDIDVARRSLVDLLATNVEEAGECVGPPNAISCVPAEHHKADKTVMGFTGKALESAEFLLAEGRLDGTQRGARLRGVAEKIIATFLRLKIAPPEGEGFYFDSGEIATARGHRKLPEVYLRSFGDDVKALLRAYAREKRAGHDHPEWLTWTRQFGDWLLTQQQPTGGFPRSWLPPDGVVYSDSPNSSFNAIPLLVQLYGFTKEAKYLDAARRAGDFCWTNGQSQGRFVGGTIDNPDVLDKEAGTLSLEAYLALYEATRERKWLDRATAAADYAETWIYVWNVPMPDDADNVALHWKRGVPTVGLQLIASGHSLVDAYMAFDVDEYARLYKYSGDPHYLDVARILLHNTKAMLALPGRAYDLPAPGWQQEHWSLAPRRGVGLHRLWLPWVATSHLNGIFGLTEFDRSLYQKLSEPAGVD